MNKMTEDEINRTLADISLVMSDGFYFLKMRDMIQSCQAEVDKGKTEYVNVIELVKRFKKLCDLART